MLIKNLNELGDLRNYGNKIVTESKKGLKLYRLSPFVFFGGGNRI